MIFGQEEKGLDSSGTGMGLYLARHVVRECGGSTWVEDNEPTGAIFVVRLIAADAESGDGWRGEPSQPMLLLEGPGSAPSRRGSVFVEGPALAHER